MLTKLLGFSPCLWYFATVSINTMSERTGSAWPRSGPASRARGTPRLQQQTWSHLAILSCHWSSYSNTELSLVILMQYTQTVERVPSWSLVLKVHSYFIRWVVYAPFSLSCSRVSWKVAYSRLQRWAHILANPMSFQSTNISNILYWGS